jgi:transposase
VDSFYGNVTVSYQEVDMPLQYSVEFRRTVCERMLAGEDVKELAQELSVGYGTLYRWRRQARVDAGLGPGQKSGDLDPLVASRRRVKELEAELKLVRLASALFTEAGGDPKGSTGLFEG